jgi:hypothetical protein
MMSLSTSLMFLIRYVWNGHMLSLNRVDRLEAFTGVGRRTRRESSLRS